MIKELPALGLRGRLATVANFSAVVLGGVLFIRQQYVFEGILDNYRSDAKAERQASRDAAGVAHKEFIDALDRQSASFATELRRIRTGTRPHTEAEVGTKPLTGK